MVSTKTTLQRMENQMVGMKLTHPRVGQYKNNSPKGCMGGELNGQHENNSPKEEHEITRPKVGQYKNNSRKGMDGWRVKWSA